MRNKEYYLDYVIFCDNLDWFFSDYVYERSPYNLYDIFEVFFYNKDRRVKIISNFCAFTDDYQEYYITEYNLGITLEELKKLCRSRVIGIPSWYNLPNRRSWDPGIRVTLYAFIKLEEGQFH